MSKLLLSFVIPVFFFFASTLVLAQTTHQVFDGESIQATIDAAAAGDTILVGKGTYTGSLMVRKKIHLVGADDRDSIFILASGIGVYFDTGSNGSSIRGFTITSSGEHGIYVHHIGQTDPFLILNNRIINCAKDGILTGNWFNQIVNFPAVVIADNLISGNKIGIDTNSDPYFTMTGNVISFNDSIGVDNFCGTSAGDSIVSNGDGDGFGIELLEGAWLTGGAISGNQGNGILINDADKAYLYANRISENTGNGIKTNGAGNLSWQVGNNLITGNGQNGILITYDCHPSLFSYGVFFNNVVSGNTADGILFDEVWFSDVISGEFTLSNNIISENGGAGVNRVMNSDVFTVSDVNLIFNNVYNNTGGNYLNGFSSGYQELSSDPLFVNAAGSDFHLSPGSPSINAGQPSDAYSDLDLSRNDQGIYGGSYAYDQYHGNPVGARLIKLTLSNRFVRQGETITIQAQGIAR
ncbi:MAG: right-handed parallel beta-helix repeat-containing protein [Bacteroidetes bacterium]|nr:right-handed parallel beta-helix repeat-containing protein [Bacteroidota bacterium]